MPPTATAPAPTTATTATKTPSAADGVAYLLHHAWRPIGNPEWSGCLWEDPTKPLIDEETKVQKYAWDQTGTKFEPVMARDGDLQLKPVFQTVFTPAGEPITFTEAMREQLRRDRQPLIEKRKEEAKLQRELEREAEQKRKAQARR